MSTEALLDARFAALPRLIRDATNPNITSADIRGFMHNLLQADAALFDGALQFLSREGHGFVLLRHTGGPVQSPRTWSRWPLKRLFATRRPSLITNPDTNQQALAFPFAIANERHVIVAPISVSVLDAAQQTFVDTLQSVSLSAASASVRSERIPRFVWLGGDQELAQRIDELLKRRCWPLFTAPTFGHALLLLEEDRVDVALLDSRALSDELSSLRALRHAAKIGNAPIVYFADALPSSEVQTLVDYVLAASATENELLRILKSSAAHVASTRNQALRASVERIDERLRLCTDFAELAEKCATAALMLGADAVSVMLADPAGSVYAAHLPFQTILSDHWPTPFVTGEAIVKTRADETFFEQAFDDGDYATRLSQLHAISAAALPIPSGSQIVGSLLAFATRQPLFQPEFDALIDLCERTGRATSLLRQPHLSRGPWQHAVLGEAVVDVFAGPTSRASICVRSDERTLAIVIVEREDDVRAGELAEKLLAEPRCDLRELLLQIKDDVRGALLAAVTDSDHLRFVCDGLPVPLRVPLSGPVAATRSPYACESGTIDLDAQSMTLIYSSDFASQIPTGDLVGAVQRGLRSSRATLARSLPSLAPSARKISFACVTMLSSDVDSQGPPAIV